MNKINFQKLTIAILLVISMSNSIVAQIQNTCINLNGNFEEIVGDCTITTNTSGSSYINAFINECVSSWGRINGTPDVSASFLGITPPPGGGQFMARIGTSNGFGCINEAILTYPDLEPGKTYTLKFHHRTTGVSPVPINLKVYQTHQIQNNIPQTGGFDPCSDISIPWDSELLYSANSTTIDSWTEEIICFTALDFPKYQILFVPTANPGTNSSQYWLVDLICIEEFEPCEPITDLTACAEQEDYGFIHFDCEEDLNLEFEWDIPQGSTAIEASNGATLFQASEGTYSVTISDGSGCDYVETFEILADCCIACEAPTNLDCKTFGGIVTLGWDEVPNAIDYEVTIVTPGISPNPCGCSGAYSSTTYSTGGETEYDHSLNLASCFSWSVKAICADGISESSAVLCYNPGSGCSELDGLRLRDETAPKTGSFNLKPRVYPNPSSGDLNFELDGPNDLVLTVEVYSFDGKLVKAFAEEKQLNGVFKKNWSIDQQLVDGLYTIVFKTNYGIFQERIVISTNHPKQN